MPTVARGWVFCERPLLLFHFLHCCWQQPDVVKQGGLSVIKQGIQLYD